MEKQPTGYVVSAPSTSFTSDVRFNFSGADLKMLFEYRHDDTQFRSALIFHGTRALRYTADIHCTSWEIEGAYDTLLQINSSLWVNKLREAMPEPERSECQISTMNHYLIYLYSFGALEVVANSWEPASEQKGLWED